MQMTSNLAVQKKRECALMSSSRNVEPFNARCLCSISAVSSQRSRVSDLSRERKKKLVNILFGFGLNVLWGGGGRGGGDRDEGGGGGTSDVLLWLTIRDQNRGSNGLWMDYCHHHHHHHRDHHQGKRNFICHNAADSQILCNSILRFCSPLLSNACTLRCADSFIDYCKLEALYCTSWEILITGIWLWLEFEIKIKLAAF